MDWTQVTTAIFSLVGVGIGAAGSLIAAFFATRTSSQQARAQRQAELRLERKEMLLDYLRAAQAAHDYAARIWESAPDLPDESVRRQEVARLDSENVVPAEEASHRRYSTAAICLRCVVRTAYLGPRKPKAN